MAKKDIIYPVFLKCCSYTESSFWKDIFEDLAYGKAPNGIYISKDFIHYNKKNNSFSYKINVNTDPKELYTDIFNLFENVLPENENNLNKILIALNNDRKNILTARWNSIKAKNLKDIFIGKYVVENKNKYNLSINDSKNLFKIILIMIFFKTITNTDISFINGKIENIDNIKITNKNIKINKNIYN